jgi:hypothetical protein
MRTVKLIVESLAQRFQEDDVLSSTAMMIPRGYTTRLCTEIQEILRQTSFQDSRDPWPVEVEVNYLLTEHMLLEQGSLPGPSTHTLHTHDALPPTPRAAIQARTQHAHTANTCAAILNLLRLYRMRNSEPLLQAGLRGFCQTLRRM